jgi:hypothetical protein
MAEAEILSLDESANIQSRDQNALKELLRLKLQQFGRGPQQNDLVSAGSDQKISTISRRGQQRQKTIRPEQLKWKGIERQDDGCSSGLFRQPPSLCQERGMTAMNAIEVANGDRSSAADGGGSGVPVKRVNGHDRDELLLRSW